MIRDNIRIALKAIRANKMRSILTTLGIIIGVAAVIAVVSVVQGLNHAITAEFAEVGSRFIQVMAFPDPNDPDMAGREVVLTYEDGLAVMDEVPLIGAFTPVFMQAVRAGNRERTQSASLVGVGAFYQEVGNHWVEHGRFFSEIDLDRRGKVAVIGTSLVDDLHLGSEPLGMEITVGSTTLTVIGILEKKGQSLGQDSDRVIVIPITTAEEMYGRDSMKQLVLQFQARSEAETGAARDRLVEVLRRRHGVPEGKSDGFMVFLQEEVLKAVTKMLGTVTAVVAAVVGIALLVGGIGIMNVMLVSVTERTREIGIRKAVGARSSDILVQFLMEAVTLSVLGGLLGIGLGMGAGIVAAKLIPGFPAEAHTPLWAVVVAVGFSGFVGIAFGTYPAAKAASLDPIDALRYE